MKNKSHLSLFIGTATVLLALSLTAETTSPKPKSPVASPTAAASAAASPARAARSLPFHGMISAADQNAKTFTIASKKTSRVFKVTDKTVITKGAAGGTMKDITANQEASGSYWKHADGTLEAKNVKLGPMAKTKASATFPTVSPTASGPPKR